MSMRRPITRAAQRYREWLKAGEEISYPKCFWQQLSICAALFLLIAGLKQVQAQPVQAALSTLRSVATTEMEWDHTIGKLEFVGNFVPESVLVFWNAGEAQMEAPFTDGVLLSVDGEEALFEGNGAVLCGAEGRVSEVTMEKEGYCVTLRMDSGLTAQLYPLESVRVKKDERVHSGQSVGTAAEVGEARRVCVKVTEGRRVLRPDEWLR